MEAKDNPYPNIPTLDGLDTCYDAFNKGKGAGIKEVVEYLDYVFINSPCVTPEDIKPKLKEWGLVNP